MRSWVLGIAAWAALAAGCNCGHAVLAPCAPACSAGTICRDGACKPGCQSNLDCPHAQVCIGGVCLLGACNGDSSCAGGQACIDGVCTVRDAGTLDAGTGSCVGQRSCGEYCVPLGGCCGSNECANDGTCIWGSCVPPLDAGVHDGGPGDAGVGATDAGTTNTLCYQCNTLNPYTAQAACQLDTAPTDGGVCPSGYSATVPDCRPCWDCRTSGGYCESQGCCGNFTTQGVVGAGCTCYSCQGFAYDFDQATSCANAHTWSHSGGPSPNGTCPWPSPPDTAFCGYWPNNSCECFLAHCGGTCAL